MGYPKPPPWVTTLSLSILLHLLLLGLITHNLGLKTQHNKPPSEPIVATLVYPVSPKIELVNEVASKSVPTELVDDAAAQSAQALVEKDAEKSVGEPETFEQTEVFKQAEVLAPQVSAPPVQQQAQVDSRASQQTPSPASLNYSVLGSGKAHMDAIEALKDQQVAAQASKAYQQAKLSPEIIAPQIDPFISEDEKFAKAIQIKTDCSNRVNLTLRVITGLTGGLVQCSELPQIEGFIQQRLKQHTRPAASTTK